MLCCAGRVLRGQCKVRSELKTLGCHAVQGERECCWRKLDEFEWQCRPGHAAPAADSGFPRSAAQVTLMPNFPLKSTDQPIYTQNTSYAFGLTTCNGNCIQCNCMVQWCSSLTGQLSETGNTRPYNGACWTFASTSSVCSVKCKPSLTHAARPNRIPCVIMLNKQTAVTGNICSLHIDCKGVE